MLFVVTSGPWPLGLVQWSVVPDLPFSEYVLEANVRTGRAKTLYDLAVQWNPILRSDPSIGLPSRTVARHVPLTAVHMAVCKAGSASVSM